MKTTLNATTSPYALAYNKWPKAAGPQPTTDELAAIHAMNIRAGCKHALACAMYLRAGGATDAEVIAAARLLDANPRGRQGVLHNYAFAKGGLVHDGLMRRDLNVANREGETVYKITLTKKGEAQVTRWLKANPAAVDAAPVAAVKKPRKPKAKPVDVPVAEPGDWLKNEVEQPQPVDPTAPPDQA